jgi:hypothetical protein
VTGARAVKTFAGLLPGSFRRIHLRQIGANHFGDHFLVLCAFKVFGRKFSSL